MKQLDVFLMIMVTWILGFLTGYFKAKNK